MDQILELVRDPAAWVALATLLTLEVVLGIDNCMFVPHPVTESAPA